MFNGTTGPSLSDIAAVTNANDGFGGNNGWWILIILFAIFGGWGNGGWNNGGAAGAANNYVLASDFATLQRQIDSSAADLKQATAGIANGLSSLGYDQLNQMNGINTNIANLGFQLQQCCCNTQNAISSGFADVNYRMATDTCAITNAINQATQSIIQNDNANYRQLHDENVAIQMAAKDAQIADLIAAKNSLELKASQEAQSQYLINAIRPYGYGYTCNGGGCCNS